VLRARARPRRRPLGHPDPPVGRRRSAGPTARRSVCDPTCCSTSTSPATVPTAGGTWASPATSPRTRRRVPAARRPRWGHRRRTTGARRDRRRRSLWSVHVHGDLGRRGRPVGRLDGAAAARRRDAPDQQRRRREQLRDARAEPAQPRLRPRRARRVAAASGSVSPPTARGIDDHPRRRGAHAHRDDLLICDADDVPIGIAGVMGGLDTEITDATTTVALEIAWFEPWGIMQTAAAPRAAVGGVGAQRTRRRSVRHRHWRSPGSSSCCRRRVPTSSSMPAPTTPAATVAARRAPVVRRADQRRSTGARHRPHAPTTSRALLDPIGFTVSGDGRHPSRRAAVVATRLHRGDRRDRGGRPSPRLRPPRQARCRSRPCTVTCRCSASSVAGSLRQVLLGLGISEAMPNPFLAPDTARQRPASTPPGLRITNPLVAEESVLRTSLRPGLLRAIAFNESHRRTGARAVRDRPRLPAGRGRAPR
jgi:hypothetical protein